MNFEAVLAGLPDAVIAVDRDLRVIFWNSAAEVLTERSARRAERSVSTSAAEFQKTIRSSASTAITASGRPARTAS